MLWALGVSTFFDDPILESQNKVADGGTTAIKQKKMFLSFSIINKTRYTYLL